MQTKEKTSGIADVMFDLSKSYSKISQSSSLHARLEMIMDMKLYLAEQEKEVRIKIQEAEKTCL
jgi:hypothetical protein|tara:strand:- start:338 stop:529 length:192 start_codon:yes stop_codon:yes gene_type:complete